MIREATTDDLPAIVDIYNSTIPSRMVTADTEPVSVDSKRAWFSSSAVWVKTSDDQIDGWMSLSPFKDRAAYDNTAELGIYVDEQRRGRGTGKALLQHAIDESPGRGIDRLVGLVFSHNVPSINLLRNAGFAEWGLLPGVTILDSVRRDVMILGLALSSRA